MAIPFGFEKLLSENKNKSAFELAGDDDFWLNLRNQYQLKPDYINLENGYYNLMPKGILDAYIEQVQLMNYEASFYKRTKMVDDKVKGEKSLQNWWDVKKMNLLSPEILQKGWILLSVV